MTINVKNCANVRAKFFFVIVYENCSDCYCNFNPCGMFEKKDVSYSNSQPRIGTRKTYDGRKFSEIRLQTT